MFMLLCKILMIEFLRNKKNMYLVMILWMESQRFNIGKWKSGKSKSFVPEILTETFILFVAFEHYYKQILQS